MTILTQTGESFVPSAGPSAGRHEGATHPVDHYRTTFKQVLRFILTVLVLGSALVGIVVLRTAAYVTHMTF